MREDVSVKRVAAFAKRLLQLATTAQPNWACGCLLLLSQVGVRACVRCARPRWAGQGLGLGLGLGLLCCGAEWRSGGPCALLHNGPCYCYGYCCSLALRPTTTLMAPFCMMLFSFWLQPFLSGCSAARPGLPLGFHAHYVVPHRCHHQRRCWRPSQRCGPRSRSPRTWGRAARAASRSRT